VNETSDLDNIKASIDGYEYDVPPAPSATSTMNLNNTPIEPAPTTVITGEDYTNTPAKQNNREIPYPQSSPAVDIERIHEIVETVVNERWEELITKTGNLPVWKERVNMNIIAIKQEIVRLNERMENLQNSVLGKVKDYDQGMKDVQSEMKALEKVFEKILEPLVANIKELDKITKDLKNTRR